MNSFLLTDTISSPAPMNATALFAKRPVTWTLILSGAIGFVTGMFGNAQWQDAVEVAQVVGGVVKYPPLYPVYIYSKKVWTIYVQILAVLLHFGATERILSLVMSGIVGMLSFQAISLCYLSVAKNVFFAVLTAPFVCVTGTYYFYFPYPITIMKSSFTFGAIGLSFLLLTFSLISLNKMRAGFFCLGLMPCIHLSLGLLGYVIAASCIAFQWTLFKKNGRNVILFFLLGFTITIISFYVYRFVMYDIPKVDRAIMSEYLWNFIKHWDKHRQTPSLNIPATYAGLSSLALGVCYVFYLQHSISDEARIIFTAVMTSGLIGIACFLLMRFVPIDRLPEWFVIAMPVRIWNFNLLTLFPMLFALLKKKEDALKAVVGTLTVVYLMLVWSSHLRPWLITFYFAALILFVVYWENRNHSSENLPNTHRLTSRLANICTMCVLLFTLLWHTAFSWAAWNDNQSSGIFSGTVRLDETPFFKKVSEGSGVLLTASYLRNIQQRARRPVLVDGGSLDFLPYVLEAGPSLNLALRGAYGLDLFIPYKGMEPRSQIDGVINAFTWPERKLDRWLQIRKLFNVTDVITPHNWELALPITARDSDFILYHIPEKNESH